MRIIPRSLLGRAYVKGSLKRTQNGFSFVLRNRTGTVTITKVLPVLIDGEPWPATGVSLEAGTRATKASGVSPRQPWPVSTGRVTVQVQGRMLGPGPHEITLPIETKGLGRLDITFKDEAR